jgi:hypothetical protein
VSDISEELKPVTPADIAVRLTQEVEQLRKRNDELNAYICGEHGCDLFHDSVVKNSRVLANLKLTSDNEQLRKELEEANTKLVTLADNCSDVLLGGECGWESMEFKEFVDACRIAIAKGIKARQQRDNEVIEMVAKYLKENFDGEIPKVLEAIRALKDNG